MKNKCMYATDIPGWRTPLRWYWCKPPTKEDMLTKLKLYIGGCQDDFAQACDEYATKKIQAGEWVTHDIELMLN